MGDELSGSFEDLLDGRYDCVDRIVLNAYYRLGYSAGGFRHWWRRLMHGSEAHLDTAHLMRMAGRFSRRVRAFAKAHQIPVVDCRRGERKHELAAAYLATHSVDRGLFLILVARAVAPVWEVERSGTGTIRRLTRREQYVNHYSFHIMDPDWGHLTIKMAGHPPFGAQVILNGHEYVACRARRAGLVFAKDGNCFTHLADAATLATVADTLSEPRAVGRLTQVCERWIYSACLCFALDTEEQHQTGFRYEYSVYQAEYSRNLLFRVGGQMEQVFQRLVDRTRARLAVPHLKTLFGAKQRPRRRTRTRTPQLAVAVETPTYGRTVFKVGFGALDLKAYTKGERVLRFEAVVHNSRDLGCGRVVARFPQIVARLREMLERFLTTLHCVDAAFVADATLDDLPQPSQVGKTRVGGVDPNKPRMRAVLAAVLALAPAPAEFSAAQFAAQVQATAGPTGSANGPRQAAYDLKKLRAKHLITKLGTSRRYLAPPDGVRTIAALLILRDQVIKPLLAGVRTRRVGPKPKTWSAIDAHYETLRLDLRSLFHDLGIAA